MACVEAGDRGFYVNIAFLSLSPKMGVVHQAVVDPKGLLDTSATLHDGKDYRLMQSVRRIRNSFDSSEMDSLKRVQGKANITDGLTKYNPNINPIVNRTMVSDIFEMPLHQSFEMDRAAWKYAQSKIV